MKGFIKTTNLKQNGKKIAQEQREQEIEEKHNSAIKSINRQSSVNSSKSRERKRSSLASRIYSPEDVKKKYEKLVEKVNKEEGVTFHPKTNCKRNTLLISKNSSITERNLDINNSSILNIVNNDSNHALEIYSKRKTPFITKYASVACLKENRDDYYKYENDRYERKQQYKSNFTNINDDEFSQKSSKFNVRKFYVIVLTSILNRKIQFEK